LTDTTVNEHNT